MPLEQLNGLAGTRNVQCTLYASRPTRPIISLFLRSTTIIQYSTGLDGSTFGISSSRRDGRHDAVRLTEFNLT